MDKTLQQVAEHISFPELGIAVVIDHGPRNSNDTPSPMIAVRIQQDGSRVSGQRDGDPWSAEVLLPRAMLHMLRNLLYAIYLRLVIYRCRPTATDQTRALDAGGIIYALLLQSAACARRSDFELTRFLKTAIGEAFVLSDDSAELDLLAAFVRLCGYDVFAFQDWNSLASRLQSSVPPRFLLLSGQSSIRCQQLVKQQGTPTAREVPVIAIADEPLPHTQENHMYFVERSLAPRAIIEILGALETRV